MGLLDLCTINGSYSYMNKHLLYLFIFVLASCSTVEKKSPNVFFAGEIVNPTSDYVVLFKDNIVVDSAKLDTNNRFAFELNSASEGLYHFTHKEYQYVYLEKGDSIMTRLNTMDFDESLVFSGKGSEINNFLLELFLVQEKEEELMYKEVYKLEPEEFHDIIDSLRLLRLAELDVLDKEEILSKNSKEIAKASINYTYYNYKELYPFEHGKHAGEKSIHINLPPDFYQYRQNLSFNNSNLNYLRPYYDFMKSHFKNLSYRSCAHNCNGKGNAVMNKLHFNRHKLHLIDSLAKEPELKDNLFRNVAVDYLLMAHDTELNNRSFIEDFHKLSSNNRYSKEIDNLYEGIQNLQPNKKIPNITVYDGNTDEISLQEIVMDKKTVFYFWSGANKRHFKKIIKRAKYLSSKKLEYNFIGINLNTDETVWKQMILSAGLDSGKQYRAIDSDELRQVLIINAPIKCIVADEGAVIVDAFSTLYNISL